MAEGEALAWHSWRELLRSFEDRGLYTGRVGRASRTNPWELKTDFRLNN
jgi:hypothetical protein